MGEEGTGENMRRFGSEENFRPFLESPLNPGDESGRRANRGRRERD